SLLATFPAGTALPATFPAAVTLPGAVPLGTALPVAVLPGGFRPIGRVVEGEGLLVRGERFVELGGWDPYAGWDGVAG
ncbi:MAG: hypothetical protein WA006_05255, partial [Rhodoglobus sp.]